MSQERRCVKANAVHSPYSGLYKVSPNVTQNLSVCNVMRSYSQLYNWAMAFESLFALGICAQLHFPTSTTICYTGSLLLSNLSPLVHLQIFFHCRGWATLKFLEMVCDKVKALSCLKPPWEEGFNEQTGARPVAHMRESVMETPLYTLQIKAKPCKCFSTHFQETGRNGPIHYCSLVSCECLGVNGLKCAPKIVKKVF